VTTPAVTVTSTSTEVDTQTSFTSTIYAACQTGSSNNQLYQAANSPINGARNNGDPLNPRFSQTGAQSAYDCCVSCILNPACAYSAFQNSIGCYNAIASEPAVCTSQNAFSGRVTAVQPEFAGDVLYILSNGYCGKYDTVN
jgi:hypothetical protein